MSNLTIDLRNFRDTSGSRVEPGRYRVQVEWAEETQARSGNTMITLGLNILGGEYNGSTLVDRLVLTDRSLFRVVAFLQAIGIPTPKKRLSISTDKFVGKVLEVNVDDGDPYNGTVKSEVRGYVKVTQQEKAADADLPDSDDDGEDSAPEDKGNPEKEPETAEVAPQETKGNSDEDDDGQERKSKATSENPFDGSNTTSDDDAVDLDEVEL